MRLAALAAVLFAMAVSLPAFAGHFPHAWFQDRGQGGGDLLVMPNGEIRGVHVIQGGHLTGRPQDLNFDLGSGSAEHRGHLALNYDVGDQTRIFNGRKRRRIVVSKRGVTLYGRVVFRDDRGRLIAAFSRRRIDFYVPVRRHR